MPKLSFKNGKLVYKLDDSVNEENEQKRKLNRKIELQNELEKLKNGGISVSKMTQTQKDNLLELLLHVNNLL